MGSYTIENMMESIRQTLVVMRENLYKQQVIFICFGVGQDEENEKVIVYGENYDNVLNAYFDDDSYALYDDARDFYIIGDKVIFFTYDDDYTRHYFISSYDGEYAPFEE